MRQEDPKEPRNLADTRPHAETLERMRSACREWMPAVRWWAALGLQMRGEHGVRQGHAPLREALDDPDACVRLAAHGVYMAMLALNAIGHPGGLASEGRDALRALPETDPTDASRPQCGVAALLERVRAASG